MTDKLSGGITNNPMSVALVEGSKDLGYRPLFEIKQKPRDTRPAPVVRDMVAEAARRSRYFMGRRPQILKPTRPIAMTDQEYRTGGSALHKFKHFLVGAIYISSRRPKG